jgi:hypothetical protein
LVSQYERFPYEKIFFQPNNNLLPAYVEDTLFTATIRGTLNVAGLHSIQISTLFLILSRIQAILFPSVNLGQYRYWCQNASLLTFYANYIVVFAIGFHRGYWPNHVVDETSEFLFGKFAKICLKNLITF